MAPRLREPPAQLRGGRSPTAISGASPVPARPEVKQSCHPLPRPHRTRPSCSGSSLSAGRSRAAPPRAEGKARQGESAEEADDGYRTASPGSPSCGGTPPPRCATPGPGSPWSPGDGRSGGCHPARALAPPPAAQSPTGTQPRPPVLPQRPAATGSTSLPPSLRLPRCQGGVSLRPGPSGGVFGRVLRSSAAGLSLCWAFWRKPQSIGITARACGCVLPCGQESIMEARQWSR